MNERMSRYITPTGLLLSAFALLLSTLLGFGGFSVKSLSGYVMAEYISKFQMFFLILLGIGLILTGLGYVNQTKEQKIEFPKFTLLIYLAVSMIFFVLAIFGLTSELRSANFLEATTFEDMQNTLFFGKMTLTSFLALGTLQVILSIVFSKTQILQKHQLSKVAKTLTLTSGILLIIKTVIDFPLIKQSIFVLSYMLRIPFPNAILNIVAPLIYLSAQIAITVIQLYNQKTSTNQ